MDPRSESIDPNQIFSYVLEPRILTEEERQIVTDILRDQKSGYELVENEVDSSKSISIPVASISPPIEEVQDHFARILDEEENGNDGNSQLGASDGNAEGVATPAGPEQTEQNDVRLYLVRLRGQGIHVNPVPVVISLSERKILGFVATT
jgi:hypothetical protein